MPVLDQSIVLLIVGGALLLLVILLIVLLALSQRRNAEISVRLRDVDDHLNDGMRELDNQLTQNGLEQRESLYRAVQGVNDSLMATLTGVSQQQGAQLSAMQKQSYESGQSQEIRQHRMHQMTEDSLAKFEARIQSVEGLLDQKLQQNENRLEKTRQTLELGLTRMQAENAQKLDEMRKTVDEKLHETLDKRLGDSFAQVSQRLEQVYKSLGEVHSLAGGVDDLKRVLSNVKTRGTWGEVQLGNLLAQVFTANQYAQNVVVRPGATERVEFAVCLPGSESDATVYLPIDSKFPQEAYTRLADASQAGDAAAVDAAQRALLAAIRTEAKRISGKYIEPPYTTDFAVMFLPLEGLYAEIMRHADVAEQIQREQRVVMAGPSTLLALLNSLQMGFRTLAIQQRSTEVWRLLGAVKTEFGNFATVLQKTQEKLQQATDSIDTAFVRTRSIERKLRRVESLDSDEASGLLADDHPVIPSPGEGDE